MPDHPRPSPAVVARNWKLVQIDSVFVGIVNAALPFVPIFVLRLGASATELGVMAGLGALSAFGLAIPVGRWLQGRRNIVPWYSRLRLLSWLAYPAMAIIAAALPPDRAIPAILAITALAALASTAGQVAFPIVVDGAAGPEGRLDLIGRRWAIGGITTAVSVALGGQLLNALPFPLNFEVLLGVITVAAFISFSLSRRFVIPDQARVPGRVAASARGRVRELGRLVLGHRPFLNHEARAFVYTLGLGLAMPLIPSFYVHEAHASDAWIGVIAAAGSAGAVVGNVVTRRWSRRRGGASQLLPALLALAALPALLSITTWLPAVAVIAFGSGIASAGAQLGLFDRFFRRISAQHGVTFSSVDQSFQNLALAVAPNIGALLAVTIGIRAGLLATAGVGVVCFALFALEGRAIRRPSVRGLPTIMPRLKEAAAAD